MLRFAVDTGGTFTDLVIEDEDGGLTFAKAPTTPEDPAVGILNVLALAARQRDTTLDALLAKGTAFIHGTTHAINAVVTGNTAKTALLTTEGHEDVLLFKEGGRSDSFDYTGTRSLPYLPRRLTFGIRERILSDGRIALALDEAQLDAVIARLRDEQVEAVAVCLLWSVVNPAHELRVQQRLTTALPGIPITISHQLNPAIREYRRASSAAIDASLKPLMTAYLGALEDRLGAHGFTGRLLIVSSGGGVMDAADLGKAPIHAINSGPAMAPVAARFYARRDTGIDTAIVGDVGGTTLDVALIRGGRIGRSREKWIGPRYTGHITGFPSVDINSVAIGGGSVARVDKGGMLHVGPESAGAQPGPACFGKGGTLPTVTDANLVAGRLDPAYFLGGTMTLDEAAARMAVEQHVALPLGVSIDEAAAAILNVATETMVIAVEDLALSQGVDASAAIYVAAGGAAGFNAVAIGRRLGCRNVVVPESVSTLSAAGALMSDITADFARVRHGSSAGFDVPGVNSVLAALTKAAQAFMAGTGLDPALGRIEYSFEARYASQIWEIEVPMPAAQLDPATAAQDLRGWFEAQHRELYAFADEASEITFTQWSARAVCPVAPRKESADAPISHQPAGSRSVYVPGPGRMTIPVYRLGALGPDMAIAGPAIVESPLTTLFLDPGTIGRRNAFGSLVVDPRADGRA